MTDVASAIDSGGVVQARTTATIAARILAPVREVRVSPGDRVRAGQTLIVLDGDDLAAGARAARSAAAAAQQGAKAAAAELLAADAGLALARASHDRVAGLQAKRSATAQELDDATATLRSAEARVAGASARALQAAAAVESAQAAGDQASLIGCDRTCNTSPGHCGPLRVSSNSLRSTASRDALSRRTRRIASSWGMRRDFRTSCRSMPPTGPVPLHMWPRSSAWSKRPSASPGYSARSATAPLSGRSKRA